jgi:hypothetical protein
MISLTSVGAKPLPLDDGSSIYVTIATTTSPIRVTIGGTAHTLDVGLFAAYETGGREVSVQSTVAECVVVHDGN